MVSVSAGDLASLGSSLTIGTRLIHLSLLIYWRAMGGSQTCKNTQIH